MSDLEPLRLREIARLPTCVETIPAGGRGVHESCLRAYQILQRVKRWLDDSVPPELIRQLIFEMESDDG